MPGFGDSAFIVILALLLFGPKKLPVLARQLGKLMADFRRASNEFRAQMEEELRIAEQADRQKQVAALEAASANTISPPAESNEAPHTPPPAPNFATAEGEDVAIAPTEFTPTDETRYPETTPVTDSHVAIEPAVTTDAAARVEADGGAPIATSGELTMLPPATGLPMARPGRSAANEVSAQAEPEQKGAAAEPATRETELETETLHG